MVSRLHSYARQGIFLKFSFLFCILLVGLLVPAFLTAQEKTPFELVTVSGETISATITSIDKDGKLTGANIPEGLDLDSLREIKCGIAATEPKPRVVIHLASGVLYADQIKIADEQCEIQSSIGNFTLGIESMKGIRLQPDKPLDAFDEALTKPLEALDQVFIQVDGQFQRIEAILDSIDAGMVSIEYEGESRQLPLDRVYGVVVASIADDGKRKDNADLQLLNGSRFLGNLKSLTDGQLEVNVGPLADIKIPLQAVANIKIRSSRLAFLSDLQPSLVEQKSLIVTVPRPWQKDLSVEGRPLTLAVDGGKTEKIYSKGLGTHAGCKLVYKNEGDFNLFAATIGIDSETRRRGDCLFVVLGDDRELFSERVRGVDEPKQIQLDIKGVSEITLLVQPGENLDLGDHADWCDARFLKTAE